jgi:release factor glutamine methyltransferase
VISRSTVVARLRAAGCVFAEDEARLLIGAASTPEDLAALVDRRVAGLPLEHVLGWAEFCGLRIVVDPGVFVPRRRTEFLARQAIKRTKPGAVVVELCCGSGAVGAAIMSTVDNVELHAVDIEPAAVACARRNLPSSQVYQGDLYQPLPETLHGRIDTIVANAPYVPTGEIALMPPEARLYEPRVALDGGPDGLDIARRVIAAAPEWLAHGGHVLVETSERQAPHLVESASGLGVRVRHSGKFAATVVVASR